MSTIKNKNGIEIELKDTQIKTIEEFIKDANLNMDEWEVLRYIANKWDVTMKINDVPVLKENWQTKLILKKKLNIEDISKFKQDMLEEFKALHTYQPKINSKTYIPETGNLMEIHIPDLHLGKVGMEDLAFNNKWSTLTAYKEFHKVIDYFINSTSAFPEKILLVLGNDMFNANHSNPFPQTINGTPQKEDDYWPLIFRFGKHMIAEAVYKLYQFVPNIHIIMVPGNHDGDKIFYLGEILEALFFGNENITIDNSLNKRKYFRWGKNLLGFAHGNQKAEGLKRLPFLMQTEAIKDWSKTVIHEWHLGDIHHNKKIQFNVEEDIQGINIRYFRTLMVGDPWEHEKGYISAKGADMLVWNKKYGKIQEITYNKI